MKSALSAFFLLLCLPALSQPVTELRDSLVIITQTTDNPLKTRALNRADKSWIAAGLYTLLLKDREIFFEVADSGLLTGSYRTCYNADFCQEKKYERGLQIREYVRSKSRLISENFDSVVSVMQYNSKTKKWGPQLKKVGVEKSYSPGGQLTTLRFGNSPYHSYLSYHYIRGVLVRENIPHYLEKKWNQSGQLYEQTIYNWNIKLIEISRFEKGLLTEKLILKSPANRWTPEGKIEYSTDPNAPIATTIFTYAEGKRVIKKELDEPGRRTVTEYDEKGKVVSVHVYPKSKDKAGVDVVAPVEVKQ